MVKVKRKNSESTWWGVLLGALFSYVGGHKILTGEPGINWAIPVPAWTGWFEFPFGIVFLFFSIRALWRARNKPEPPVNRDEEAARAKAELDAMYLRDHGTLPEKPEKD